MKIVLRILLPLCMSYHLQAQTAKEILDKSIASLGSWPEVKTLSLKTTRENHNKWQMYKFRSKLFTNDEAIWEFDYRNNRYYSRTVGRYGGGYEFIFVTIGKDTTRYVFDENQSRNGKEMSKGGKGFFDQGFEGVNAFLPYFPLKNFKAASDSMILSSNSGDHIINRITKNGALTEYVIDSKNFYLKSIIRLQGGQKRESRFEDYTTKQGVSYPQKITQFTDGETVTIDLIRSINFNNPFDESLLRLPADYKVASSSPVKMTVAEIKKDVHLIEDVQGGRNVIFYNMNDHIFITEAPLNTETSKAIIDLVRKTIPGKPIRYVHISHFHNDHSNGIRAFVNEGVTILTTAATAEALKTIIDDPQGLIKDGLSVSKKPALFEVFKEVKIISDDKHRVELHEVKNNHAEGLSFVYLPAEMIIYEGDLYSLPDDGTITPAIEITKDFAKYLKKNKISYERIIGHHGHSNITAEILGKALTMK